MTSHQPKIDATSQPGNEPSRFYQSADPDILVELFTLDRTPHVILWRASAGFSGWFKPAHLDKHAPFTRVDRPAWATHTVAGKGTSSIPSSPELVKAETDHARALVVLHAYEQKAVALQEALAAAREEVRTSRRKLTTLKQ